MPTQRVLSDIPEAEVNQVVESFKSEGCTVTQQKQDDGNWTIIADCPDKQ